MAIFVREFRLGNPPGIVRYRAAYMWAETGVAIFASGPK